MFEIVLASLQESPTLYIVIFASVLTLAILFYIAKSVTPVSNFLYANARVQARSTNLITERKLKELTELKSLVELSNNMRDTDYSEELDNINKNDIKQFHSALEKSHLESFNELIKLSPDDAKVLLNAYLMFTEAKVIKTIYKAKYLKINIDEELIFRVGNITSSLLKHMTDANSLADLKVVMEKTPYAKVFETQYTHLEKFDDTIDEFVLNNFVNIAQHSKMYDAKYIVGIVNMKIDILNLMAILKFRIRNIDINKRKELLINNRTALFERSDALIKAEKLKDVIEACKGLSYYEPLNVAYEKYEKDASLLNFENELYKFYRKIVVGDELNHSLGPYPLFCYLMKKELELKNLFIITKAIDSKKNIAKELII